MDNPVIGEQLAIDLVNTRTTGGDLIATPPQLSTWLASEQDRLPPFGAEIGPAMHQRVLALRDQTDLVLRAVMSGRKPPTRALRHIEGELEAAPPIIRLGWDGSRVTVSTHRGASAGAALIASLAEAAIALLAAPDVGRLKECEAEDCRLLFLPAHPRRRWCSSQRCGNRVRVARHYQNRGRVDAAGA